MLQALGKVLKNWRHSSCPSIGFLETPQIQPSSSSEGALASIWEINTFRR